MNKNQMITKIAKRAVKLHKEYTGQIANEETFRMDILATDTRCPLDLEKLLKADDGNFGHDVFGINRHLNRETFELDGHFLPRCSA